MTKRILTTEEKPGVRTAVLVPVAREVEEGAEDSHEIEMSFSSEEPVERWGYEEVLDHSPGSVRLGQRQQNMPLLFNHNRDDLIGKVERRRSPAALRSAIREDLAWRRVRADGT